MPLLDAYLGHCGHGTRPEGESGVHDLELCATDRMYTLKAKVGVLVRDEGSTENLRETYRGAGAWKVVLIAWET